MTLFQDLQIAEVVLGDITSFAGGSPVAAPAVTVGSVKISASAQLLPNGPTSQFVAITGVQNLLALGFEAASGAPVSVAEKIGNTWIGYTITVTH